MNILGFKLKIYDLTSMQKYIFNKSYINYTNIVNATQREKIKMF